MHSIPLVSVAIITYNQKTLLIEAIESVLAQDYEPIQIVVGDDCSTDGSREILLEYQNKYPDKFTLMLAETNGGITSNSNAVHFACKGKYIAWLGGDDLMMPGKINKQVAYMEANPNCNIVYHNLDVFDSATGKHLYFYNQPADMFTGDIGVIIRNGSFNGGCATMVRRSATPLHGFDARLPVASDWLFWIESLENGGKICYINEVLARYRMHDKNVTNQGSALSSQGFKDVLTTCDILMQKYPAYKKDILYRLCVIYRGRRKYDYLPSLKKSLQYDKRNFKTRLLLTVYKLSFGKIKL